MKVRFDSKKVLLRTGEYECENGRYEYRYSVFGKRYSIYAKTLEELREKERNLDSLQETGLNKNSHRTTVNEVFEIWKELKRGIRANTFQNYCYLYEMYVRDTIGKLYVDSIKRSDVKRYFNYLNDERNLKLGTIDGVHTVLHQVLQMAVDDELIFSNPSDNAIKELMRSHNMTRTKRRALTIEEQNLLLDFITNNHLYNRWYPIIVTLLDTGMRVGEATGLRWCDIDFKEGLIDINHTLVYYAKDGQKAGFAINDTKTPASMRQIPMTDRVKKALLLEKEMQEVLGITCNMTINGYTDFVFLNRFGGLLHQGTLNKVYKRIIRDCNDAVFLESENPEVLLPNFSCHILRHTYATRLCESGINIKVIQDVLGHTDITTTMNIYVDVTNDLKKKEMEAFLSLGGGQ